MFPHRLIALVLLALAVTCPGLAMAQAEQEPAIYVIKKGDTLWGLSERFLKDPHYWPDLWSRNRQITNPHLIYPGQQLRVFPDRIEVVPQSGKGTPTSRSAAKPPTTSDINQEVAEEKIFQLRGNEGYLMESDSKPFGSIIGSQHDHTMIGMDDIVYTDIGSNHGVKGGEKFLIFRPEGAISHPLTNEIMGTKIIPLGALQLTDVETTASRAIITKNFREISLGAYLMPYKDERRREVALKNASRELKGYIVESGSGTNIIAEGDVVYIDLGSSQGVEPGNLLYIVRDTNVDMRYTEGRVDRLPQELLGATVVLETGKKTATCLVVKSIDAIYRGDRVTSSTK